jgi:hypothetical protein
VNIFDEEVIALLKAFEEAGLRYILIGGFAVNMHGHWRATGDVDVWVEESPENRRALRAAMRIAGYGDMEEMERMQFVAGWTGFRLNSGFTLDLMTSIKGFAAEDFPACYERSVIDKVDDLTIRYFHRDDLLHAKKAAGRPKDVQDIIALNDLYGEEEGLLPEGDN